MTVAALPGNVRLRAFQLGKETTFGTAVPATRRFGWTFAPTVDPHWTFPTSDTGTLDNALPPYRMAVDVTGTITGPLAFNDAPYLWAALAKGGVTPTGGGTAKTWAYAPASTSQDIFEIFTGEWGDDTTDQFQYADGVLDSLTLTYPQDLGPITVDGTAYRFASVAYPVARTGGLQVDPAPTWAYAADTSYYFNDTAGAIDTTQLVNSVHDVTLVVNNNLDVKRFQNGSQLALPGGRLRARRAPVHRHLQLRQEHGGARRSRQVAERQPAGAVRLDPHRQRGSGAGRDQLQPAHPVLRLLVHPDGEHLRDGEHGRPARVPGLA
jgi:hypothetical protein